MEINVVLGLGSNSGDRIAFLNKACDELEKELGKIQRKSSDYETEPWGFDAEISFINRCIEISTSISPETLLSITQTIEKKLGRTEKSHNGVYSSRVIDIDILFYGNLVHSEKELVIPHPLIFQRNFVLVPLNEILPGFTHPITQLTIEQMTFNSKDKSVVRKIS